MEEKTYQIALGGILTATAVSVMTLGSILPFSVYLAPITAAVVLYFIVLELGVRFSVLVFLCTALLSVLIVPDKESAIVFSTIIGWYPIFKLLYEVRFCRLKKAPFLPKLLLFNLAVLCVYSVLFRFALIPELNTELTALGTGMIAILLVVSNLLFLLFDRLLDKMKLFYFYKIRPQLFRKGKKNPPDHFRGI